MKWFGTTILILLIAVQSFGKWLVLLNFEWNRDYIAQTLCENRAKPELKCGGKCQLAKKLAAEEAAQGNKQSSTAKIKFAEAVPELPAIAAAADTPVADTTPQNGHYQFNFYTTTVAAPFHPPASA